MISSSQPSSERAGDTPRPRVRGPRLRAAPPARVSLVLDVFREDRVLIESSVRDASVEILRLTEDPPADEDGEKVEVDEPEDDDEEAEHAGGYDGDVGGGVDGNAGEEETGGEDAASVEGTRGRTG